MTTETVAGRARLIGTPVQRVEDERFLRGTAVYVDDVACDDARHIAFVRSPHANARIVGIDIDAAAGQPGVLRVFTAADVLHRTLPLPPLLPDFAVARVAHPLLAAETVAYAGQIVAAVVASTRAQAEDAAELVDVTYDPLAPVNDLATASAGATLVHAGRPDNVLTRYAAKTAGCDDAFARAATTVSASIRMPRVMGVPMETRGGVARYDAGRDLLTVWCSAQDSHRHREDLAHALGRPEDRVHVIVPDVGGGFGIKGSLPPELAIAAWAAIISGETVKWVEDRLEHFLGAHHGRGVEADVELALDEHGRMLALRARVRADLGAFILPASHQPGRTAARLLTGAYAIPDVDVEMLGLATNRVPTSPYRGAGRPEAAIVIEQAVDLAARRLGIDPIEMRRRNIIRADQFPYRTPMGYTYDSGNYERLLERLEELCDFAALRREQTLARLEGRVMGIGIGMYIERSGGTWESARVSVEPDGRAIARMGSCPHGQGHETTFAQIVGDALGLPMNRILIEWGDSRVVPRGVGTFASRSTMMGGSALWVALQKIKVKATRIAASMLETEADDLRWDGDALASVNDPARRVRFADVARRAYEPGALPASIEPGLDVTGAFASDFSFGAGVHAVVLEIDRATGKPAIREIVAVDDAGTIINPLLAEGQVLGGIAQGIGQALYEEAAFSDEGQPLSVSFLNYHVPTAVEMPPVRTAFLETPSPITPLGAKGVGEGGACGTPAAIANAVADALAPLGAPHVDFPLLEAKLWAAMHHAAVTA
jgi:carbon-monoxide dehydrogenase large subunit